MLADPLLRVTVPRTVLPSMKVMLPVIAPDAPELTEAVKMTFCPKEDGFTDELSEVDVAAWFTVWLIDALLPAKFVSPL